MSKKGYFDSAVAKTMSKGAYRSRLTTKLPDWQL